MVRLAPALLLFGFLDGLCNREGGADEETEREIRALLDAFEASPVKLERNGRTFSNAKAHKWFTTKWKRRRKNINSADDFIEDVVTRSSTSNKRYQIVLQDGSKVNSSLWFRERLIELRKK